MLFVFMPLKKREKLFFAESVATLCQQKKQQKEDNRGKESFQREKKNFNG
jgi:hypothetical protein